MIILWLFIDLHDLSEPLIRFVMKKIFAALFVVCLSLSTGFSQSRSVSNASAMAKAAERQDTSVLKFDKMAHDFGAIPLNGEATVVFTFVNRSKKPVSIQATSTCGCTVPDYPTQPVRPGAKGTIKVQYIYTNMPGMFQKDVEVTTLSGESKTFVLTIRGVVDSKPAQSAPARK